MSSKPATHPTPQLRKQRRLNREIPLTNEYGWLSEAIIEWYCSLGNTDVVALQLQRSSGALPQYFVLLTLNDQSTYRFQRPRSLFQNLFGHKEEPVIDTVERVSRANVTSKPLIKITFSIESPARLSFVLATCRGIKAINRNAGIVADNEFFALALIAIVARRQLPQHDIVKQTSTPLQVLWSDVRALIYPTKQSFWERSLAGQTRSSVRTLVCQAARHEMAKGLARQTPHTHAPRVPWHIIAASAVSWTEILAEKQETSKLSNWDRSWGEAWDKEWGTSFSTNLNLKKIGQITGFIPKMTADGRASGATAGRVPTRIHIKSSNKSQPDSTTVSTVQQIQVSSPDADIDVTSVEDGMSPTSTHNGHHDWSTSPEKPTDGDRSDVGWLGRWCPARYPLKDPLWLPAWEIAAEIAWAATWMRAYRDAKKVANSIPKASWNSIPTKAEIQAYLEQEDDSGPLEVLSRTISKTISKTMPSPEATRNRIDEPIIRSSRRTLPLANPSTSSESHVDAIDQNTPAQPPRPIRRVRYATNLAAPGSVGRNGRPATPGETGTSGSRLRDIILKRIMPAIRENKRLMGGLQHSFEEACVKKALNRFSFERPSDQELDELSQAAWERAKQVPNSAESDLDSIANQAWARATESSGRFTIQAVSMLEGGPTGAWWKQAFVKTWEQAWKKAWISAWLDAWNSAEHDAAKRGIESGVKDIAEKFFDRDHKTRNRIKSLPAVQKVHHALAEENTYAGSLRKTYSMFRELGDLSDKLRKSIPLAHGDVMEIRLFVKKKSSVFGDQLGGQSPVGGETKLISHIELQEHIQNMSADKFGDNHRAKQLFVESFAQVWENTLQSYDSLVVRLETRGKSRLTIPSATRAGPQGSKI